MLKTYKIQLGGQVQGVGFRPFVYRLATRLQLKGTVCNDTQGVVIVVNGTSDEIKEFMETILERAPDAAHIRTHSLVETKALVFDGFSILPSPDKGKVSIPLTADFAICESCKTEIQDPNNRRYQYAFTTCTQCGPRYAITEKFPFERAHTSMKQFTMCESCFAEYENPDDSRFHSQTNSCSDCGIRLQLIDRSGGLVAVENESALLGQVARFLKQGAIVALKNTNGYLLCVDAQNTEAVQRLRRRKQRPTKPFALLYPDMESIRQSFELSPYEQEALESRVGPIVLLDAKRETKRSLAREVAPGLERHGVMLPSSALVTLLMAEMRRPLVATSGNIHGSPILSTENEAVKKLAGVADYFVHHNLEITFPQDDTVCQFTDAQRILLRRSRGLAPNLMAYTPKSNEKVLAMGAQLKSTLAFTPNGHTYVSPYFGDLSSFEVLQRYTDTLQRYTEIFEELPELILVDQHPSYQSTQLGKELAANWKLPLVAVQHHKAHFASLLAEQDMLDTQETVLGVIWDGTGFGEDGMIWGGEFFTYRSHRMERVAHFDYFASLAGDKMAREPRLSLLSLMEEADVLNLKFSEGERKIYQKLKKSTPLKTSSVGRLFDAVASLLGILDINGYEGEAALLLEDLAWQYEGNERIDLCLEYTGSGNIPSHEIIQMLVSLRRNGESESKLAAGFIHTLAKTILKKAQALDIHTIACSGGVFQNRFLIREIMVLARENDLQLVLHQELSPNDENIALGQLAYYQHINE